MKNQTTTASSQNIKATIAELLWELNDEQATEFDMEFTPSLANGFEFSVIITNGLIHNGAYTLRIDTEIDYTDLVTIHTLVRNTPIEYTV